MEDRFYLIVEVDAEHTNMDHLNFVKGLKASSTYQLIQVSIPFFAESEITSVIDYIPVDMGKEQQRVELMYMHSQRFYDVFVGKKWRWSKSQRKLTYESIKEHQYAHKGEDYWQSVRTVELTVDDYSFNNRLYNSKPYAENGLGADNILVFSGWMRYGGYPQPTKHLVLESEPEWK